MAEVSTNGWDLVYSMRFNALNDAIRKNFETEQDNKANIRQAIAQELADGINSHALLAQVTNGGSGYKSPPGVTIDGFDGPVAHTTATAVMGLEKVSITNPIISETSILTIDGNHDAAISIGHNGQLQHIVVTDPGYDYLASSPPVVTFSNEGTGSGASAVAIVNSLGQVSEIKIINPGNGYTSPPTVTIAKNPENVAAQAIALLAMVKIDKPGAGFTTIPTIKVNGVAATAEITLKVVDVIFQTDPASTKGFNIPPLIKFNNTGTSGQGAIAYAMLGLTSAAKHLEVSDTALSFARKIFKKAFYQAALSVDAILNLGVTSFDGLKTDMNSAIDTMPSGTKVEDVIKALAKVTSNYIQKHTTYEPNPVLYILKKAGDDKFKKEADFILKSRNNADKKLNRTISQLINDIQEEEDNKTVVRVQRALRSIEASIIFNYFKTPQHDSSDYYKKMGDLPGINTADADKNAEYLIVNTAIEAATAITPETAADQIIGLGNIVTDIENPFQKVALYTGAWQVVPGGNQSKIAIKIPITGGLVHFGKTPVVLKPEHQLFIELSLSLAWLKGASSTTAKMYSGDKSVEVNNALGQAPQPEPGENRVPPAPKPTELSPLVENILTGFIKNTLNKVGYNPVAGMDTLAPLDYAFEYHHTFATLDIYETLAEEADGYAWMYPTSTAFAVIDEDAPDPDPNKSIFSICCMTENRASPRAAIADYLAIPEDAMCSVAISKNIVLSQFIFPVYLPMFLKLKTGYSPGQGDEDILMPPSELETHLVPVTMDDFVQINENSYRNKEVLYTRSFGVANLDKKGKPLDEKLYVRIPKQSVETGSVGGVTIQISSNEIELKMEYARFRYKNDMLEDPYKEIKITAFQVLKLSFESRGGSLAVIPKEFSNKFDPDFRDKDQMEPWVDFLINAGISLVIGVVTAGGVSWAMAKVEVGERGNQVRQDPNEDMRIRYGQELEELNRRRPAGGPVNEVMRIVQEEVRQQRVRTAQEHVPDLVLNQEIEVHNFRGNLEANFEYQVLDVLEPREGTNMFRRMRVRKTYSNGEHTDIHYRIDINNRTSNVEVRIDIDRNEPEFHLDENRRFCYDLRDVLNDELSRIFAEQRVNAMNLPLDVFENMNEEVRRQMAEPPAERGPIGRRFVDEAHWSRLLSAFVLGGLSGWFIWLLRNKEETAYDKYLIQARRGVDNQRDNGITYLTQNLTSKIKIPAFDQVTLSVHDIELNGSLVIGLIPATQKTLFGTLVTGLPKTPFAQVNYNSDHFIRIHNTGDYDMQAVLVRNEHPYQGHKGEKVGNSISIPRKSNKDIQYSEFGVTSFEHLLISLEAVSNETTYNITIESKS